VEENVVREHGSGGGGDRKQVSFCGHQHHHAININRLRSTSAVVTDPDSDLVSFSEVSSQK